MDQHFCLGSKFCIPVLGLDWVSKTFLLDATLANKSNLHFLPAI